MTHKRSRLPGWMPGTAFARGTSDAQAGSAPMRARVLSLVLRPITPPLVLGLVVAALLIVAESLLVYLLKVVAPGNLFGVVFLLGVLVVSIGWGFRLGTMTALVSAFVYAYFHHVQTGGSFIATEAENWVAVIVFLVVSLSATTLAGVARLRAVEAVQRRREVEATHDELRVLAEHQAALRRVATLVARGVTPSELFSAVAEELARCLGVYHHAVLFRYEPDGTGVLLAAGQGDRGLKAIPVGERFSLEGDSVAATVFRTAGPARMVSYENAAGSVAARFRDLGLRTAVGAPIIVDGHLWGAAIIGSTKPAPLPPDTEARVGDFTDLVATALANGESREALGRLADEQAALRRVATLVAQGVRPAEIFLAVSEEVDRLFGLDEATVGRFDPDGPAFVVLGAAKSVEGIPIGSRWEINDLYVSSKVLRTGRSARVDASDLASVGGPTATTLRRLRLISQVGSPIIVEGRLWGALTVVAGDETLPADTEERLEKFAELAATAIANADSRSELAASRRRIVAASDETRRRIERNLHDGTQQRLVSLALAVREAEAHLPPDSSDVRTVFSRVATGLTDAVAELQEISRGIHPVVLSRGGLGPALRSLARRSTIPVEVDVASSTRFPEPIEVAAYFVASEALANVTKHSQASCTEISLTTSNGSLQLSIRDDGVGGADPARGSGLVGLTDRVEALGGSIHVRSSAGHGTQITAELPVEPELSKDAD